MFTPKLHKGLFSLAVLALLVSFTNYTNANTAFSPTTHLVHVSDNTQTKTANYVDYLTTNNTTSLGAFYGLNLVSLLSKQNSIYNTQLQLQRTNYLGFKTKLQHYYQTALYPKADCFLMCI